MRFSLDPRFACLPAVLADTLRRPDCEAALLEASGLDLVVDSVEVLSDGATRTRAKVTPRAALPRWVQTATGVDRFRYVQVTEVSADGLRASWRIEPLVLADRVQASGTTRIDAAPGGCVRVFEGEVLVRARFVGAAIEQGIVEDLRRGHDRAVVVIRLFLGGTA